MKRIEDKGVYRITPKDIDISVGGQFWILRANTFGYNETISAGYIIKLCQQNGGWIPFTKDEIEKIYSKTGLKNFQFHDLVEDFIILEKDQKYYITEEFVERCYESAPQKK